MFVMAVGRSPDFVAAPTTALINSEARPIQAPGSSDKPSNEGELGGFHAPGQTYLVTRHFADRPDDRRHILAD